MALTAKQIYDLNHMNVAAQNVQLGTLLNKLITGGGAIGLDWSNLDDVTRARLMAIVDEDKEDENNDSNP